MLTFIFIIIIIFYFFTNNNPVGRHRRWSVRKRRVTSSQTDRRNVSREHRHKWHEPVYQRLRNVNVFCLYTYSYTFLIKNAILSLLGNVVRNTFFFFPRFYEKRKMDLKRFRPVRRRRRVYTYYDCTRNGGRTNPIAAIYIIKSFSRNGCLSFFFFYGIIAV